MTQNPNGQYLFGQTLDFVARVNGVGSVYPILTVVDFAGNQNAYPIPVYQTANAVVLDNNLYGLQIQPQYYGDYVYQLRVFSDPLHTLDVTETRLIDQTMDGTFNIVSRDLDESIADHTLSGTFGWIWNLVKSILKGMGWNMTDASGNTCPLDVKVKNGLGHTITIVDGSGVAVAGRIIDTPNAVTFWLVPGVYTVIDLDNCNKISQKMAVVVSCDEPVTCRL